MVPKTLSTRSALRRLWQPRRGLFWLVVVFNALSSGLAWWLHLTQPTGLLLGVLTLLALSNAVAGWWLLSILWREGATNVVHSQGES